MWDPATGTVATFSDLKVTELVIISPQGTMSG